MGRRLRALAGLWVLAELVVFVLVAHWIGVGATILATLATSAVGLALLGRQGTRALADLRERARSGQPPGRALGDAGLVAVGGMLMLLPGFLGDLVGLLCLLPFTRALPRALLALLIGRRLPGRLRGAVRVRSDRVEEVGVRFDGGTVGADGFGTGGSQEHRVIEGEVLDAQIIEGDVLDDRDARGPR